ncbi:uncharacterized protein [Typha latifolia]|uniref:uncharacterized protein n=1 Tax=Typha latifolia TaxID=4733 RepID=UPI003C2ADCD6
MPFPMKIQPIDPDAMTIPANPAKPAAKSRLKRLFERQFPGVLRISSADKLAGAGDGTDTEPSSVCLDKMVQSFMEEGNEKPSRCGRNRCNCFHGNCDDSSDDDLDLAGGDAPSVFSVSGDAAEVIKGLVLCASVTERNLLADASSIVEKNKSSCKRKDDLRSLVAEGLRAVGYEASICKSRWEKSPSFPAGEYEYVDVIVGGDRILVDVDFRSEFEIARSTKSYRAVLQSLPSIFVGKDDRLQQIVAVASEAAKHSLRKKGLHFPPWRKPEYMRAKWLSPYERSLPLNPAEVEEKREEKREEEKVDVVTTWQPPEVKPKAAQKGAKVVTGLASVLKEKP